MGECAAAVDRGEPLDCETLVDNLRQAFTLIYGDASLVDEALDAVDAHRIRANTPA
jgi:hypothetical protein